MDNIDNSFVSETSDKSPDKLAGHFLCSEIEQCGFNGWDQHSVNWSEGNEEQAEQSIEEQPPKEQNLATEQQPPKNEEENDALALNSDRSSISGPKTITIIEDTLFSKETGSVSSKVSQYSTSITNQSYSSFLYMKQTVYDVHHRNYEELYKKISDKFEQRFQEFQDMYATLFRVKYEQESMYLGMKMHPANLDQNQAANTIYINCQSVIGQLEISTKCQSKRRAEYIEKLEQLYEQVKRTFSELRHQVHKRKKQLLHLHNRLKDLGNELSYFMLPKESRPRVSPPVKEKFYGNKYVISKYMIKREESFLQTLKIFTSEVISFINLVCREIQPKLSVTLKDALLSFVEASCQFRPKLEERYSSEVEALTKINCFEIIYEEMAEILIQAIPKTLLSSTIAYGREMSSDQYLEGIIEKLNMDAQTFIYLPCVEEDDQNLIYSSQGKTKVWWRRNIDQNKAEEMQINVIISRECHMVLEAQQGSQNDKIATLKLGEIKLSRKQKQIILTDRGKSMLDLLLNPQILGELFFQSSTAIDEMVQEIKQLMHAKKEKHAKLA